MYLSLGCELVVNDHKLTIYFAMTMLLHAY